MPDEAPFRNFNFRIEVEGLPETRFREVDIPWSRIEAVEYREGGDPVSGTRKLPGRSQTGDLVLRRGIDRDLALWTWFKEVRDGTLDRRKVRITLLDAEHAEVRSWQLENAWPTKYTSSSLHGQGNEVVIETIELVCERVDVEA